MADTIINNPGGSAPQQPVANTGGDNGGGFGSGVVVTVLIIVLVVFLAFFVFGRGGNGGNGAEMDAPAPSKPTGGTNIQVPEEIDINVDQK